MRSNAEARPFRKELRRLLLVPIAALLVLAALLGIGILKLLQGANWVDHSDQVIAATNHVQRRMIDQETGARGFLLSRDPVALQLWNHAMAEVPQELDRVAALVIDNPSQERQLEAIRKQHAVWQKDVADRIAHPDSEPTTGRLAAGKEQMDAIRSDVDLLLQAETALKAQRTARSSRDLRLLLILAGLLSILLGVATAWWLFRRLTALNSHNESQAAAIYREQQWLQTTLRSIGDAVVATDAEGNVTFMNAVAEACTGWSELEARNRPLSDIFRIVNETTREIVESPVDKVKKTGLICGLANHTILIRKDGTEISIDDSGAPIRDANGTLTGIVLVFRDIEARRVAERELEGSRKALQGSETQFRQIAEGLPNLVWMTRPDGYVEWFNQRWYEYTGGTPEASLGTAWTAFFHPDDRQRTLESWNKSITTGEPYNIEYRCRRHDGEYCWFLGSGLPLKDEQGEVVRWFGTCTYIHPQKEAELALAIAQERMRVALKSAPLILYTTDRELRYTWMHRAHPKFKMDEIIGLRDQDLEPSGSLQPLIDVKRAVIESGAPQRREVQLGIRGEIETYDIVAEPLRDVSGAVAGMTVAALDVTERARAEQELREKSELIDLAQFAVHAGYWSYYPATGECFLSPGEQELFGIPGSRPKVEDVLECIHPEDRDRVGQTLEEGMRSGAYFAEFRIVKADGSTRWLAGQGRVLTKADGERYMVGINFDVTHQKSIEDALRRSEKLAVAGRLAATISHEINNPLESVTNLLYLLRTSTDDDGLRQYALMAEEELARVTQIVTHSLRFHRQSTMPTNERMSALLDSAAAIYRSRMVADSVHIKRDYRELESVRCYSSELRQVFGNFVGNAFDAMRHGGTIRLRTRDAIDPQTGERGVRVTVADTGHGMDDTTLQRIFEPFFTTKGLNGTGLGLWISRDILKKHHAKVRIKSCHDGIRNGTVFLVFLPLQAIRDEIGISETTLRGNQS